MRRAITSQGEHGTEVYAQRLVRTALDLYRHEGTFKVLVEGNDARIVAQAFRDQGCGVLADVDRGFLTVNAPSE